ncbi:MAG: hypothetical protein U1F68_14950 [Gammaproteobacteria bacterium]
MAKFRAEPTESAPPTPPPHDGRCAMPGCPVPGGISATIREDDGNRARWFCEYHFRHQGAEADMITLKLRRNEWAIHLAKRLDHMAHYDFALDAFQAQLYDLLEANSALELVPDYRQDGSPELIHSYRAKLSAWLRRKVLPEKAKTEGVTLKAMVKQAAERKARPIAEYGPKDADTYRSWAETAT